MVDISNILEIIQYPYIVNVKYISSNIEMYAVVNAWSIF